MQTERLLALACWLENGAKHIGKHQTVFDMSVGIRVNEPVGEYDFDPNACGTACCVAGAAVQFFAPAAAEDWISGVKASLRDEATHYGELNETPARDDWYLEQQVGFFAGATGPRIFEVGSSVLGLTERQARMLFLPSERFAEGDFVYDPPGHAEMRDYTDPAWAARVIRRGVETGDFNWHEVEQHA